MKSQSQVRWRKKTVIYLAIILLFFSALVWYLHIFQPGSHIIPEHVINSSTIAVVRINTTVPAFQPTIKQIAGSSMGWKISYLSPNEIVVSIKQDGEMQMLLNPKHLGPIFPYLFHTAHSFFPDIVPSIKLYKQENGLYASKKTLGLTDTFTPLPFSFIQTFSKNSCAEILLNNPNHVIPASLIPFLRKWPGPSHIPAVIRLFELMKQIHLNIQCSQSGNMQITINALGQNVTSAHIMELAFSVLQDELFKFLIQDGIPLEGKLSCSGDLLRGNFSLNRYQEPLGRALKVIMQKESMPDFERVVNHCDTNLKNGMLSPKSVKYVCRIERDPEHLLPLAYEPEKQYAVLNFSTGTTLPGAPDQFAVLGFPLDRLLEEHFPNILTARMDANPSKAEITYAVHKFKNADVIIVLAYSPSNSKSQLKGLQRILKLHKKTILILYGTDIDQALFPDVDALLRVQGVPGPGSYQAIMRVLNAV